MRIQTLSLQNIRAFRNAELNLSETINLFVGKNNSGKSTVLRTILALQGTPAASADLRRLGEEQGVIHIQFYCREPRFFRDRKIGEKFPDSITIRFPDAGVNVSKIVNSGGTQVHSDNNWNPICSSDFDDNPIVPILTNRKQKTYTSAVNQNSLKTVDGTFSSLSARLDLLIGSPNKTSSKYFVAACEKVLGLSFGSTIGPNGKTPNIDFNDEFSVDLNSLGDGIASIVGILTEIALAKHKVIIIEEPENDIHPEALQCLCELIRENSGENQFLISTHSNVVLTRLLTAESKVFSIEPLESAEDEVPVNEIVEAKTATHRQKILGQLGYSFRDLGFWNGWLVLEESSAERVINQLIRIFTPRLLGEIRTISSNGVGKVESRFNALHQMFLLQHLGEPQASNESAYDGKAWVLIDSGEDEAQILEKMKKAFKSWDESHFRMLNKHAFEDYYPTQFETEIREIEGESNWKKEGELKGKLASKIVGWMVAQEEEAREHFENVAPELIQLLKDIEAQLMKG